MSQSRKLHAHYAPVVFGLLTSATFALIMSGVLLLVNRGLVPGFIALWMRSFGIAFIVAFPTSLIVIPIIRRVVGTIVDNPNPHVKPEVPDGASR